MCPDEPHRAVVQVVQAAAATAVEVAEEVAEELNQKVVAETAMIDLPAARLEVERIVPVEAASVASNQEPVPVQKARCC